MSDSLAPVTGAPSPEEALKILDNSAATPASAVEGPVNHSAAPAGSRPPRAAKKKGGWPKGKPRGKKATTASSSGSSSGAESHVYDGTAAANLGGPPPGAQQVGPGAARIVDPALVEQCKPAIRSFVKAATGLIARMTGKPSMRATADECDLFAETGAPLLVARMPAVAEASPEMAFAAAVLSYALPRFTEFGEASDGVQQSAPIADPTPAAAPVPAVIPRPMAPSYPGLAQTGPIS